MASRITAIRQMRADLKRDRTLQTRDMIVHIASRSALSAGEIKYVVYELQDEIVLAARSGQAVKVDGLGTFTPVLRANGSLNINFRADPEFLQALKSQQLYARIVNKANLGKSADELVAAWNEAHPDDPVEEQAG